MDYAKYIFKAHKTTMEEPDLAMIEDGNCQPGIMLTVYSNLIEEIKNSAKRINDYYKSENVIFKDYDLDMLFHLISPQVFNFVVLTTLSRREKEIVMSSDQLPFWLNGHSYILERYNPQNINSHRTFVRRVFLSIELIFIAVRGDLLNPMSMCLSDLINKYSGSTNLTRALNNLGLCYSDSVYRTLRTQMIEQEVCLDEKMPMPLSFRPHTYHYLSIDNYDQNMPHGVNGSIHTLGTLLNVPNIDIKLPNSMKLEGPEILPTAPETDGERQRRSQIRVPLTEPQDFIPAPNRGNLIYNIQDSDFFISEDCKVKIRQQNENTLAMCCAKTFSKESHTCKPTLRVIMKGMGVKPQQKAIVCHLRMVLDDPSSLRCIQTFLETIKESLLEKYHLQKVLVAADGKIYDLLMHLISSYGAKYRWVIPYLGEFHTIMSYLSCLSRKYGGFFLQSTAENIGIKGATLIKLMKIKDYRLALHFDIQVMEAIILLEIRMFGEYVASSRNSSEVFNSFKKKVNELDWTDIGKSPEKKTEIISEVKKFSNEFFNFIDMLSEESVNFRLLNSYAWEDCSALVHLLGSIQSGNHSEKILAMKRIIPLFFSFDRVHYKK